jgi:hypoxanthine-DNA glycosylase
MQERHVKHPFPAVIDSQSRILILGSVPSVKSVENNFYYMHPQNRFWRVLGALFGQNLYLSATDARKSFLLEHKIALYDSVEECDIQGSSDTKITNVVPADIPALMAKSKIAKIFCNGAASYGYLMKFHPELETITLKLPSTSPANAQFKFERLVELWEPVKTSLSAFSEQY